MNAPDLDPPGLRILRTTVYFEEDTGAIVHVHQIAAAESEEIDDSRIQEEADAFEESLDRRHGRRLDRLTVDKEVLLTAVGPGVNLRVDIATRALVREHGEAQ